MRKVGRHSRLVLAAALIAFTSSLYAEETKEPAEKKAPSAKKAAPADSQLIKSAIAQLPPHLEGPALRALKVLVGKRIRWAAHRATTPR